MIVVADHPVDTLLAPWGLYLRHANDPGLGYAQSGYAERIGKSYSATDYVDIDPDVLRLDELVRKWLPPLSIAILRATYEYGWKDAITAREHKLTRSEVSRMRTRIIIPALRIAWDQRYIPEST